MIEEDEWRRAKIFKKEEDYFEFIRSIRNTLSDSIITDISPSYLSEPRGLYRNQSRYVIKPRSTKEVSECLKLATKYKIAVTTVKGKAFLIKIFTPFEKSFLSSSLDKDIICLIE